MRERELNQVQKELYKRQIISYIFKTYSLYKEAKEDRASRSVYRGCSGLKSADDIAAEIQGTIQLARRTIKGLSMRHRLALCDFPVGYWIWLAWGMIRQGK